MPVPLLLCWSIIAMAWVMVLDDCRAQKTNDTIITPAGGLAALIEAFHARIATELEAANVRGAAYAFRGPVSGYY